MQRYKQNGGGQILVCTAGEGWYQEEGREAVSLVPGMVVTIPANVKHWHGAKAGSWFSHIAIEIPGTDGRTDIETGIRIAKENQVDLIPTYPSSGSEYGLGAVSVDSGTGDFGTAYGIAADHAVLVPKYSLSLGQEMTAYKGNAG